MRFAAYVLVTLQVFATLSSAQEKNPKPKTDLPANIKQRIDRSLSLEPTVRARQMKTMIAFISGVCDLDDEQVKQLELASKSAVKQSLSTSRKLLAAVMLDRQRTGGVGKGQVIHRGATAVTQEATDRQRVPELFDRCS